MCGAPAQSPVLPPNVDVTKETVIYGVVSKNDAGRGASRFHLSKIQ
jgi:hypothetical protein